MRGRARRRPPRLLMTAWLVTVWVALWEDVSAANLLSGLALGSMLMLVFPMRPRGVSGAFRPAAVIRFAGYFTWKLVEASAVVTWEVLTPSNRINEGIVAVPIRGVSDTVTTLVANAISLTPGTLTLEVDQASTVLYVHVLHLHDIEAVRREIQHLEVLAIRAFGSPEAVALAVAAIARDGERERAPSRGPRERRGQP